jgi:hypothetical protein
MGLRLGELRLAEFVTYLPQGFFLSSPEIRETVKRPHPSSRLQIRVMKDPNFFLIPLLLKITSFLILGRPLLPVLRLRQHILREPPHNIPRLPILTNQQPVAHRISINHLILTRAYSPNITSHIRKITFLCRAADGRRIPPNHRRKMARLHTGARVGPVIVFPLISPVFDGLRGVRKPQGQVLAIFTALHPH